MGAKEASFHPVIFGSIAIWFWRLDKSIREEFYEVKGSQCIHSAGYVIARGQSQHRSMGRVQCDLHISTAPAVAPAMIERSAEA